MADGDQAGVKREPCSPTGSEHSASEDQNNHTEIKTEQDQPLDFSKGRRSSYDSCEGSESPPRSPHQNGYENGVHSGDENSRSHSSVSTSDSEQKIGEPQLAKPGTLPGTVFPGMIPGLFPGYPGGFPAGFPMAGATGLFGLTPTSLASALDQQNKAMSLQLQQGGKHARPFKAYPKDPLSLPLGYPYNMPAFMASLQSASGIPEGLASAQALNQSSEELFNIYRQQVMKAQDDLKKSKHTSSSGESRMAISKSPSPTLEVTTANSNTSSPTSTSTSTSPSRKRPRICPDNAKDESYWDRRRKNNEAAKRSRDARRAKEDEIAIRAAFLEQENLKLRVEVAALKTETAKLRCMLMTSNP